MPSAWTARRRASYAKRLEPSAAMHAPARLRVAHMPLLTLVTCMGGGQVFPLMVGGSLQARLDLKPRDIEQLVSMGHFSASPSPLTWRQKVKAVCQAVDALLYLHKSEPCVLHRDFKPANILLDASLKAFLGDTGFAKAAQRSGDASQLRGATTGRVMGSPGYAHKDVLSGRYSEITEGYAVGVTLLVVLTRREPVDIEELLEDDNDGQPFAQIPAALLAEADADWPAEVAGTIKHLYTGLCVVRKRDQLKLRDVHETLRALLHSSGEAPHTDASAATASTPAESVLRAALPDPSPLSLQVRGMRRANASEESVQRNVSEAFDGFMRRLGALFSAHEADAPKEFDSRLRYWHTMCGLPSDTHTRLQKLRIWRNASLHHDAQRWATNGPRSAQEASEYLAHLQESVTALEGRV
jgi:serine/threonine protein kinase